jgi:hydroxymethylbilane synthase
MVSRVIKIGTRSSRLAIAQTNEILSLVKKSGSKVETRIIPVKTAGDIDRRTALEVIGGYGLFTRAIERELLDGNIDIAIHSAKDLPSRMTNGLTIAAVPRRGSPSDVWISRDGSGLMDSAPGSVVGTGSPRRRAELKNVRRDLRITDIRGNVDTRIRKLESGECDCLIMAQAGLERSGLLDSSKDFQVLDHEVFIPAPGQGTLLIQARKGDDEVAELLRPIEDPLSRRCLDIERAFLSRLYVGCSTPVGAYARRENNRIRMSAVVLDKEGETRLYVTNDIDVDEGDVVLVEHVVNRLIDMGAKVLIDERRG